MSTTKKSSVGQYKLSRSLVFCRASSGRIAIGLRLDYNWVLGDRVSLGFKRLGVNGSSDVNGSSGINESSDINEGSRARPSTGVRELGRQPREINGP